MSKCPPCGAQYRQKLVVQRPDPNATANASGHSDLEDDDNWLTVATIFAAVLPKNGREFFRAKQTHADLSLLLRAPYSATLKALDPDWRLVYTDEIGAVRKLNVLYAFDEEESHREIEIGVREAK